MRRHCGKIAPGELEAAAGAEAELRLVFHSNQGDACKGFAFQYRLVKSKSSPSLSLGANKKWSLAHIYFVLTICKSYMDIGNLNFPAQVFKLEIEIAPSGW